MQTLENSVRLGYTHTSVGGRLKWVAGQTGWSIGGELEYQSSSVHRVANTGRDRNLFRLSFIRPWRRRGEQPTNTRSCSRSRITLLRCASPDEEDYLFERISPALAR